MLTRPVDPGDDGGFSGRKFAGFSLIPWCYLRALTAAPDNLVRTVWRPAERAGALELVAYDGFYLDTGTPADYLAANLHAAAPGSLIAPTATVTGAVTDSVIGPDAIVAGSVTRCVIWPGAQVAPGECLSDVLRAGRDLTVTG
jgi:mannose-1-phosphate guanylyltransferase/MurNAc alpha-1-phosphate uridylyltransferase